jgi:pyruvate formate lyase activating enzyme
MNPPIAVGGLTPLPTTAYPGCMAAVVFCQGCPWRCGYCQNPHLISRTGQSDLDWAKVAAFLERRVGLLEAVVFSGGEPLLQKNNLARAMQTSKALGFKVGLHTGGAYPDRFAEILPLVDWVGFDVKALPEGYAKVTSVPGSDHPALHSLRLLLGSGIDYEVRTTLHADLHTRESGIRLAAELAGLGVRNYVLQPFRAQGCADENLCRSMDARALSEAIAAQAQGWFERFEVR